MLTQWFEKTQHQFYVTLVLFFPQWPVKMATDVFVRCDRISPDVQTWLTLKVLFTWQRCKWKGSVAGGHSTCHILLHSKVKWCFFMFSSLRCLFKWQSGVNAVLGLTITLFPAHIDSPFSISFILFPFFHRKLYAKWLAVMDKCELKNMHCGENLSILFSIINLFRNPTSWAHESHRAANADSI